MPKRTTIALASGTALLAIAALGLVAWLVSSVNELHERFSRESRGLGLAFLVILIVLLAIGAIWLGRLAWQSRAGQPTPSPVPNDVIHAASIQANQAEGVIRQVKDETVKAELNRELGELRTGREQREFRVVIFGTGSAGKTSLINALLGRDVGKTEAILGTTQHAENHTYSMDGIDGTVFLTDTPGLSEIGAGGAAREQEARELAARADLLIFVLDHDLIRTEFEPLSALVRQGKRSIVLLNKTDRFSDEDRDAILAKLRERLRGLVPADDVIAGAADPRPTPVLIRHADGSTETTLEEQPPNLGALRGRISRILKREGDALRAGNLLLRAHLLSRKAQDQVSKERDQKAEAVIEKFQWMTAATVFTNPFPALELLASGAVQFQMITELAGVYGVTISTSNVRMYGTEMIQMLLKLGLVEATTSLIAGIFKSSLVGYAAGGAVQAVSMAYLTHISGETFAEYFRRGQTWGDGGLQAALIHQFDLTSRADFLQEFAKQAVQRVSGRFMPGSSKNEESPASRN
ncbi:MAG: YcjF family protein [Isosphaeraceae bacterium]